MCELQLSRLLPRAKYLNGQPVVTFSDIDIAHQRPNGTAGRNFRKNKMRFLEGIDFFQRNSSEAKHEYNIIAPNGLILLSESGYLMVVKSFTDDLSWKVQRVLVNSYFRAKETLLTTDQKMLTVPAVPSARPELSNPLQVLHILLDLARVYGMTVTSFGFTSMRSALYDKCIGIRSDFNVADTAYELAFELAHAIVHNGYGDMVRSPLAKEYNQHAERIAELLLRAIDTKIKLAL